MATSLYQQMKVNSVEFCANYFWDNVDQPGVAQLLIQYYIDLMGHSYQLAEDGLLEGVNEDLILSICNSKTKAGIAKSLRKTSELLHMFFNKAYEEDKIEEIVSVSINFLNSYIDHKGAEEDNSKAICCFLLVLHINPLARLLEMLGMHSQDPLEASMNHDLNEMLKESLQLIMRNSTAGLKYNKYSEQIAKEFFNALKRYNEFLVNDKVNYLSKLRDFLLYDNLPLLRITISNISKLCFTRMRCLEELKKVLVYRVDNSSIIDLLVHLIVTRNIVKGTIFLTEILSLFIELKKVKFSSEIIDFETRIEIYTKIFPTTSPALQVRLLQMMVRFEDEVLMVFIKIFNKINASSSFIERVILNTSYLTQSMLPRLIEIASENFVHDEQVAYRACQLLTLIVKILKLPNETNIFNKLPEALESCARYENMFGSLLNFVVYLDAEKVKRQITPVTRDAVVTVLLTAFVLFEDIKVLQLMMNVLGKVSGVIKHKTAVTINTSFGLLYGEFLEAETSSMIGNDVSVSHKSSLVKICLLLENNVVNFVDYFGLEAIFVVCATHLENHDDPLFPFFVRLQTALLQKLWNLHVKAMLEKLPVPVLPFTLNFVVDFVEKLAKKLLRILNNFQWNLLEARNIFCSLTKLLFYFFMRPTLVKDNKFCLTVTQPKVTGQQMRDIVNFAEFYVFRINVNIIEGTDVEKFFDVELQKTMLGSLSELVKNHSTLPNVSCLFKIVMHLRQDSHLKNELELLLKFLLERKKTFEQTIGLVVIQFAKQERSVADFIPFVESLEKLLERIYMKKEVSYAKWHICEFVAKQLRSIVEMLPSRENDRLALILEFLRMLCCGVNQKCLGKLTKCFLECFESGITAEERESLKQFFSFLSSNDLSNLE